MTDKKVHGLSDLQQQDKGKPGQQQGQLFWAGGEKSGVAIEGPPRRDARDAAERLFDEGRRAAREAKQPKQQQQQQRGRGAEEKVKKVSVVLWANGVTVTAEGENESSQRLRAYDAQETRSLLDALDRGEVPEEFESGESRPPPGTVLDFAVVDRRGREFSASQQQQQQQATRVKPFSGAGMVLGGGPTPVAATVAPQQRVQTAEGAGEKVDESKPVTNVQVRLAAGGRIVGKFNGDVHTIADLRSFIDRKTGSKQNYELVTAFPPPTVLSDLSMTLAKANLLNAAVVQRLR